MEEELSLLHRKVSRLEDMVYYLNDKIEELFTRRAGQVGSIRHMLQEEEDIYLAFATQLRSKSKARLISGANTRRYHRFHQRTVQRTPAVAGSKKKRYNPRTATASKSGARSNPNNNEEDAFESEEVEIDFDQQSDYQSPVATVKMEPEDEFLEDFLEEEPEDGDPEERSENDSDYVPDGTSKAKSDPDSDFEFSFGEIQSFSGSGIRPRSDVWKHFNRKEINGHIKVGCKYCKGDNALGQYNFTRANMSTGNLLRHLRKHHKGLLLETSTEGQSQSEGALVIKEQAPPKPKKVQVVKRPPALSNEVKEAVEEIYFGGVTNIGKIHKEVVNRGLGDFPKIKLKTVVTRLRHRKYGDLSFLGPAPKKKAAVAESAREIQT